MFGHLLNTANIHFRYKAGQRHKHIGKTLATNQRHNGFTLV